MVSSAPVPSAPPREAGMIGAALQTLGGLLVPLSWFWVVRPWMLPETHRNKMAGASPLVRVLLASIRWPSLLFPPFGFAVVVSFALPQRAKAHWFNFVLTGTWLMMLFLY